MYLIIKHDFDNMENHDPWFQEIVGYVDDEVSAIKWINETTKDLRQYKGCDGGIYPYYEKKFIEKLLWNVAFKS